MMKFHHIGYLTNNINNSLMEFKKIHYKKKGSLVNDKNLHVKIQFIKNENNIVELVKPYSSNYSLLKIIKNHNYAYHFAYKVKNLNKNVNNLKKKGFKLIVNPVPAKAFNNNKIAFLKMKNGFIIELIES